MLYTEITVENPQGDLYTRAFRGDLLKSISNLQANKTIRPYTIVEASTYNDDNMETIASKQFC